MDWIKKNYDRFTLAVLALALLASAWVLWSHVNGFADNFAAAMQAPVEDNKIVAVDMARIDEAKQRFEKPAEWQPRKAGEKYVHSGLLFTSEKYYLNKVRQLEKLEGGGMVTDSVSGKTIANDWFTSFNLNPLDPTAGVQDPDGDGFLNEDEWRAQTDPTNKESHPAYETKLFFRRWIKEQFRFKFLAHDFEPGKDMKPEAVTFQINALDAGGKTQFVKLGEEIQGTKFKVTKFENKEKTNPNTGGTDDVSELTLTNTETNDTVLLLNGQITNSPTQRGEFEYFWGKKPGESGQVFVAVKGQVFALRPKIDPKDLYKLLDVNDAGGLIQRPDGEKYQVPPVPKK